MARYTIGDKDVTVNDVKDINPAPEQSVTNHPLGDPYIRLGKANGQQTPALHFSASSVVDLPNTSDVKESERNGQIFKLEAGGFLTITTSALAATGDTAIGPIAIG